MSHSRAVDALNAGLQIRSSTAVAYVRSCVCVEREESVAARAGCGFPTDCTDGVSAFEQRLCRHRATESLAPTSAQSDLANSVCASCQPDDATCLEDFFFRAEPRDDGSVGVSGIGASFFHLNDALIAQIQADCVPAVGADRCLPTFYACIDGLVDAAQPASVVTACSPIGPAP